MINKLNMLYDVRLIAYFFIVPSAEGLSYDSKRSTHPAHELSEASSQVGSQKRNRCIHQQPFYMRSCLLSKRDIKQQACRYEVRLFGDVPLRQDKVSRVLSKRDISGQSVYVKSESRVLPKRDIHKNPADVKSDCLGMSFLDRTLSKMDIPEQSVDVKSVSRVLSKSDIPKEPVECSQLHVS